MIVSTVENKEYFWIKIPRTATYSYKELFKRYNEVIEEKHIHHSYLELCKKYDKKLPGFTVVRHPLNRFKSILYYLASRHKDTASDARKLWESTESCIELLNSYFQRNCQLKGISIQSIFLDTNTDDSIHSPITAFFKTQVEYAYHPKVNIFYYERMDEFKNWIETTLKYDTTNTPIINSSCKTHTKVNVDFNNPDFIKTIENLYYVDYKAFNYPLQYLT